jgi:AcrR family transcriptional regulator
MSAVATETADRILDAACEIIAEEGIDEVRIARVATRARASSGLVHHYFSTREELLEQALVHSFERAGDDRFGDGSHSPPGSATETFGLAIRECLPFAGESEREWVLWVELWLRAVREPGLREVAAKLYDRYRRWLAAIIRAGAESGEFTLGRGEDEIADIAMALLDGAGIRAMVADPKMDVEAARALVAGSLAPLLGVDPEALR